MVKKRNKKGTAAVFIMVMMTGMMGLFMAYIGYARETSVKGSVNALGRLWADSILAEYDLRLYEEYGLMAYIEEPGASEDKILEMAEYAFGGKNYADIGECVTVTDRYSLADTENFKKQLIIAAEASEIDLVIDDFTGLAAEEKAEMPESEEMTIRNRRVLNSLPSAGRTMGDAFARAGEFFRNIGSLKDVVTAGTDRFLTDRYIKTHFRNMTSDKGLENRFLLYEEEYILCGRPSDAGNRRGSKAAIIGVREVMNMVYLNSCETKKNEALALGTLLMPEAPEVMQETLLAGWALAESFNDYQLLIRGKTVPFMKDDETWATTLTGVVEGLTASYIDTGCETGDDYQDYISGLMSILPEETKLLRIMDLIQINLKYTYRSDFLIADLRVGVDYIIEINGKAYEFSEEY